MVKINHWIGSSTIINPEKLIKTQITEIKSSSACQKAITSFKKHAQEAKTYSDCFTIYKGKKNNNYIISKNKDGIIRKTYTSGNKVSQTRLYKLGEINKNQYVQKTYINENGDTFKLKTTTKKKTRIISPENNLNTNSIKHGKYKWLSQERFILSSDSDRVIKDGRKVARNRHSVPKENIFKNFKKTDLRREQVVSRKQLSKLTMNSRLDLHGHGSSLNFEYFSPQQLAQELKQRGLREVGVIKLQSCSIGCASFPDQFVKELSKLNIRVGYVSSMKGGLSDVCFAINLFGKKFNIGIGQVVNCLPKSWMTRVTKGNVENVKFFGTRYC